MSEKIRVHIFVSGRVQGVSFRYFTRRKARKLGITGWVCNLPDGRVEAVFESEKEKVEQMLEWAKENPFFARVEEIDVQWQEYQGEFQDFKIRY